MSLVYIFIIANIFLVFTPANAFEMFPEYSFLDEREVLSLESPAMYDSEYESDYLTYFPEHLVTGKFNQKSRYFTYLIGSLSGKEFMTTTRLKVSESLDESKSFTVNYVQEQSRVAQKDNLFIDLGWAQDTSFKWSLLGQAQFDKRNNDFGVSFEKVIDENSSVKLLYWLPDFVRNEHNDQDDYFQKSHKPQMLYLSYNKFVDKKDWYTVYVKAEPWVKWIWPEKSAEYYFERYSTGFSHCKNSQCVKLNVRTKFEKINNDFVNVREHKVLYRSYLNDLFWGVYWVNRDFSLPTGSAYLNHVLPHIEGLIYKKDKTSWRLGADATVFVSDNSAAVKIDTDRQEYRANLKYIYNYSEKAYISLFFTFDVDELFSSTGWEGGAGEFVMEF